MTKSKSLYHLVLAGVLCAIGIIIPMFSPIKIRIDPMSFTLASHVAVFLAMFISPAVGAAVALGTTLGYQGWTLLYTNFAVESAHLSAADNGLVQSLREVP